MKPSTPINIFILISVSICSFGQKKIEIQLLLNPTFSSRFATAPSKDAVKWANETEKGMMSYDIGVMVVPFKTQKIALGTGLVYSRKGFTDEIYLENESDRQLMGEVTEIVEYIEVPIRATYSFTKSLNNYIIVGLLNDIFLNTKYKTSGGFDKIDIEKRKYNLGINIGIGHDFKISDSMAIGVEPMIKFQTMNYKTDNPRIKRYLYTVGLALNYKFGV